MNTKYARFLIGQPVKHKIFEYRGVILDVDPIFSHSSELFDLAGDAMPPKNEPWYYVLVDNAIYVAYISEMHLQPDLTGKPISHPDLEHFFSGLEDGLYRRKIEKLAKAPPIPPFNK